MPVTESEGHFPVIAPTRAACSGADTAVRCLDIAISAFTNPSHHSEQSILFSSVVFYLYSGAPSDHSPKRILFSSVVFHLYSGAPLADRTLLLAFFCFATAASGPKSRLFLHNPWVSFRFWSLFYWLRPHGSEKSV